jgi:hypothetical protein
MICMTGGISNKSRINSLKEIESMSCLMVFPFLSRP